MCSALGKPQKNLFLVARPLRGGGGKGLATKTKELFLKLYKKSHTKMWPLSLVTGPLKRLTFFAASLTNLRLAFENMKFNTIMFVQMYLPWVSPLTVPFCPIVISDKCTVPCSIMASLLAGLSIDLAHPWNTVFCDFAFN